MPWEGLGDGATALLLMIAAVTVYKINSAWSSSLLAERSTDYNCYNGVPCTPVPNPQYAQAHWLNDNVVAVISLACMVTFGLGTWLAWSWYSERRARLVDARDPG